MKKIIIVFIIFCCFNFKAQNNDTLVISIINSHFAIDTSYIHGHHLFTKLQITNVNKMKSFDAILLNNNNEQVGIVTNYILKQTASGFMYVENNLSKKYSIINGTIEIQNIVIQSNYVNASKIKLNYFDINNLQRTVIGSILK